MANSSRFDDTFQNRVMPAAERAFGVSIQLRRGSDVSAAFTAVWDLEEYQSIEHETGLAIVVKRRVYRFDKSDAVIGVTITPRAGDILIDGSDTMTILPFKDRPAVQEEPGGYRWLVRTDRLA